MARETQVLTTVCKQGKTSSTPYELHSDETFLKALVVSYEKVFHCGVLSTAENLLGVKLNNACIPSIIS